LFEGYSLNEIAWCCSPRRTQVESPDLLKPELGTTLADTLQQMKQDGIKHALAFFTCTVLTHRQYREDIQKAQAAVGAGAPGNKPRVFYNHPGFIEPTVENVQRALEQA
jgi:protoheme ferro-lyase